MTSEVSARSRRVLRLNTSRLRHQAPEPQNKSDTGRLRSSSDDSQVHKRMLFSSRRAHEGAGAQPCSGLSRWRCLPAAWRLPQCMTIQFRYRRSCAHAPLGFRHGQLPLMLSLRSKATPPVQQQALCLHCEASRQLGCAAHDAEHTCFHTTRCADSCLCSWCRRRRSSRRPTCRTCGCCSRTWSSAWSR
jgi:hypothetical protein